MREQKGVDWKPILLEALFVVLGVVLAFAANEYRESQNQIAKGQVALESIREEVKENRVAVKSSYDYHAHLSDTLRQIIGKNYQRVAGGQPKVDPDIRLFTRGFISPARVLSTSWDTARSTDAVAGMQYDDLLTVSKLYAMQEGYQKQSEMVGSVIYGGMFEKGSRGIVKNYENMAAIVGTFYWRERELLEAFDKTLDYLNKSK